MEGNFGSLSFQHGSRPDYPVDDKKANSDDLPITRISKCAEEGKSNTEYSLGSSQQLQVKKVYKIYCRVRGAHFRWSDFVTKNPNISMPRSFTEDNKLAKCPPNSGFDPKPKILALKAAPRQVPTSYLRSSDF